jgi:hypothetical protein
MLRVVVGLAVLGPVGCADDDDGASGATTTSTAAGAAFTTTTTSDDGTTYSSDAFVVPLTVRVDDLLDSPPDPDSANLLSWEAAAPDSDDAVRFLVPVEVYRPGSATPEPPPADFVGFLTGLAADTAEILDLSSTTVDGRPAMLMSLSRFEDASRPSGYLDGTLGCPVRGADQFEGCFGPQPDLLLRLAVIDLGDETLLAWARVPKDDPDEDFIEMFERMLATVRFG